MCRCSSTATFQTLLLAPKRSGIHSLYRWPLDAIEELTTGQAHQILVNSKFTQGASCCDGLLTAFTFSWRTWLCMAMLHERSILYIWQVWNTQQDCAGIFQETFRRLDRQGKVPEVFYPAVPITRDDELAEAQRTWQTVLKPELAAFMEGKHVFLSINRFERKKV